MIALYVFTNRFLFNIIVGIIVIVFTHRIIDYKNKMCYLKFRYNQHCNLNDYYSKGNEGTLQKSSHTERKLKLLFILFGQGQTSSPIEEEIFDIDEFVPPVNIECDKETLWLSDKYYNFIINLEFSLFNYTRIGRILPHGPEWFPWYLKNVTEFPQSSNLTCIQTHITSVGIMQMFYLGKYLDTKYQKHKKNHVYDIILRSINDKTTRLGGLSLLAGILEREYNGILNRTKLGPPAQVLYTNDETGLLLTNPYIGSDIICPKLTEKLESFYTDGYINNEAIVIYDRIISQLSLKLHSKQIKNDFRLNLKNFEKLMERIYKINCYNRTHLSKILYKKFTEYSEHDLLKLIDIIKKSRHLYVDPKIETFPLMMRFFELSDEIISTKNSSTKKSFPVDLNAAHNDAILAMILTLGLPKEYHYWPPISSRIVFELWINDYPIELDQQSVYKRKRKDNIRDNINGEVNNRVLLSNKGITIINVNFSNQIDIQLTLYIDFNLFGGSSFYDNLFGLIKRLYTKFIKSITRFYYWFKYKDIDDRVTIRIYYNGEDITCKSALCNDSCVYSGGHCMYQDFKHLYFGDRDPYLVKYEFLHEYCA